MSVVDLPTGTLTLLFSDIEGSTSLLSRIGDGYGEVLSAQREIMRAAFAQHAGHEMGTEGDSFFVVFGSVSDALNAAVDAQLGLHTYPWPDGIRIGVRMGLHTGEPSRHEDGYVGMDVHRAARIAACAHGGQVLVSESTYRIAVAQPLVFLDLGWHRLKDIPQPEHLYQLTADGLPRDFPRPRSMGSRATLPLQTTPIVGRDGELTELQALITASDVRLIVLTGPGGCGKTRLAVAAASTLENEFPDGIYFVPLEEVTAPDVMWTTIAEVLGLVGDGPTRATVLEHMSTRSTLLLLDNLEQIEGAADVVADLLMAAPKGVVLATSRRPLHLAQEYDHPVPPLTLPTVDGKQDSGAVRLFLQRARMVRPGFTLTDDNAATVADICRRLDGLPLAIELAAARVKLISPQALLSRLDASLQLSGIQRGRPARQQTLGNTIAWSYGLLPPEQQAAFRRLGVFAGGADLAACAAVTNAAGDPLDLLVDLGDASLVQLTEEADGEPRMQLLQTIATFAREKLTQAGELADARQRHAEHYLVLVTELKTQLRDSRYLGAKSRIEAELDNLRAALDWALPADGTPAASEPQLQIGLRLCQELSWFWYACGYHSEGRRWLSRGVAAAKGRESSELMATLHMLGILLIHHGENAQGRDVLLTCLEFWRRAGDLNKMGSEKNSLACAYRGLGEPETARKLLEESIADALAANDDRGRANALTNLAMIELDEGRTDRAIELLRETLEIDQRLGDPWGVAHDHSDLALATLRAGRAAEAYRSLCPHAADALAVGDEEISVSVIQTFALIFAELGDSTRAAQLLGTSNALRASAELPISAPDAAIVEESISKVRDLPDLESWALNLAEGGRYTLDEALATALADR